MKQKNTRALINLTGRKFGRWIVVGPHRKIKGITKWFCRCDCGTEGWPSGQSLRGGHSKSCGCLTRESTRKRFLKDLTGMRFGRLVVFGEKTSKNRVVHWLCNCECGSEKWVSGHSLRAGATQSCGCLNRELTGKRAKKIRKRYRIVLNGLQRGHLAVELKRGDLTSDRALQVRAILLADEGPEGPCMSDNKIALKLNITRSKAEYIRMCFAAPEVQKKRIGSAQAKANSDPRLRKLRVAARLRYDQKPENREKKRAYQRNLPPDVRERKNRRAKEYRSTDEGREKKKISQRIYRNTPQGKLKKRMYVQRQKTQSNQRYKIRYQTDPQFKMAVVVRKRVILALKARGASKSKSLRELIGCSIQELKQHLESKFREGMSWENHGEWHVDHIRPCADFDLTNPEEQKNCFHFSNLQPLWAEENLRKSNKLIP